MPHRGVIKAMSNHVNNHHVEKHPQSLLNIIYNYSQIIPLTNDSLIAQKSETRNKTIKSIEKEYWQLM